jgi:hypothetical protein
MPIVELSDTELDLVTGGCNTCESVLLTPAQCGKIVEQANACNTPAGEHGLDKGPCDNGARCICVY